MATNANTLLFDKFTTDGKLIQRLMNVKISRALTVLHERFPAVPLTALTTTASAPTRRKIVERWTLRQARQFVSNFECQNIYYYST